MQRRSLRYILLATATAAAGLALASGGGAPAGAAVASQGLNCGVGGNQTMTIDATAPSTVVQNAEYEITLAQAGPDGVASGAEIKDMTTTFQAPTGSNVVAGSVALIPNTGSGTLGNVTVSSTASTVQIKVPGPIANGASFRNPSMKFKLKATGAVGSVLRLTYRQNAAYTLTAAGSFNVTCNANTPLTNLTSTTIQAPPTTTTTTQATTTTTGGPTSSTSTPSSTTSTTSGPTTTAPPVITTQNWSPGTACGVPQTVNAPANTTSVAVTAVGGKGGQSGSQASSSKSSGGNGGQAYATFPASGGQTFSAVVGCNGANGANGAATTTSAGGWSPGGSTGSGFIVLGQTGAGGGGGGGSSAACVGADCVSGGSGALVVAGGGGGGGVSNCAGTRPGAGGAGGAGSNSTGDGGFGPRGNNGSDGGNSGDNANGGDGGAGGVNTDLAQGAGGSAPGTGPFDGFGVSVVGGGGGGGYAGGAAGQNQNTGCKGAGGGGGGSSWVKSTASNATFSTAGTPSVVLTFTISTPATTTTTQATTSTTQATTSTTQATTSTTQAPCAADKVPFASVTALVNQQYQDFTGKAPTTAQRDGWVNGITACTSTADELIVSLLPTSQTTDDARLVRLYLAYFKRPPDPSGFAYWQRQLDAGKGLINAALKFAQSNEFKTTYGSLNNSQFIDLVYQNVLDRDADPTGKAFWLNRLDNKTANRGTVMVNFSESSENQNKRVNEVGVFRMFRSMRQKFPSQTEFNDLVAPILNNGKTLRDAAKTIRTSPAYAARF